MDKLNLLIVDDEINTLETLRDIFEAQGEFNVFTANNGKKAVDMARERFFNIILMDVKMPVMNGVEAFKQIKKISVSTEVIMMTGYSVDELLQEAVKEGVYAVVNKPINIPKLNMIIEGISKRMSVLVVDDSEDDRTTLSDILISKGFRVSEAENGYRGLEVMQFSRFDMILLDVMMPGMDGIKTLEWIKEISPDTGVIIVSGKNDDDLVGRAIKMGALAYLSKPVDMSKMLEIIEGYRKSRHALE